MLLQATGLALLAALSPTALLITAVYLGSARPRLTAGLYLTGALATSLVTGIVILALLRNAGLSLPAERTPRYGLRIGLGILILLAGVAYARRKPRDPQRTKPGLVSKMTASPAPISAFTAGVLVFAPGVTFLAALQAIATARARLGLTALAVLVVVIINVLLVWLPIVFYLVAPEKTSSRLAAFNGWLRAHSKLVLTWVLIVVGVIMISNGIYGLAAGR